MIKLRYNCSLTVSLVNLSLQVLSHQLLVDCETYALLFRSTVLSTGKHWQRRCSLLSSFCIDRRDTTFHEILVVIHLSISLSSYYLFFSLHNLQSIYFCGCFIGQHSDLEFELNLISLLYSTSLIKRQEFFSLPKQS